MKTGLIHSGSSYEDVLKEKTRSHARIDRSVSLEKVLHQVKAYDE